MNGLVSRRSLRWWGGRDLPRASAQINATYVALRPPANAAKKAWMPSFSYSQRLNDDVFGAGYKSDHDAEDEGQNYFPETTACITYAS
jgi:hypothetical protein